MGLVYVCMSRVPQLIICENKKDEKQDALKCTSRIRIAKVKGAEKRQNAS